MRLLLALILLALEHRTASIYTFGSGHDGCSQHTPYCENTHACAGVPGGGAKNTIAVFNHTLRPGALLGVMDHFWWCAVPIEVTLAQQGLRPELRYFVDGEAEPSVVYEPAMAVGQAFAGTTLAGEWYDAQTQVGNGSTLFNAGSKMGRSGIGCGGWWHRHPVLFQKSIRIEVAVVVVPNATAVFGNASAPAPPLPTNPPLGCIQATAVVRGYERNAPFKTPAGVVLPLGARMRVQRIESETFAPREFVPLATIPPGHQALMYLLTFSTATRPWTHCTSAGCATHATENNYVEGCWHLMRTHDEPLPGLITGTGLEDGLDSSFGFNIINFPLAQKRDPTGLNRECNEDFTVCKVQGVQFQTANTGMLTFMSDYTVANAPIEKLSVYRFFDDEVFAFDNGGTFGWHNGAFRSAGTTTPDSTPTGYGGKCWDPDAGNGTYSACGTGGGTCDTMVRSYAWYFIWPNSSTATFA